MHDYDMSRAELGAGHTIELFKHKFGLPTTHQLPQDTEGVLMKVVSNDPAVRPVVEEIPSNTQIEEWRAQFMNIFENKEAAGRIADKLLGSLRRISEAEFELKLLMSYRQAMELIGKEDLTKASFVYYSGGGKRSSEWVRGIAKDYFPQDEALELPLLDYYDKDLVRPCDIGIIMDDASYSGAQVVEHIKQGHQRFGMKKFYVIVPFMTNKAKADVESLKTELGIEIETFVQDTMPTLDETLGEIDFKWLRNVSPAYRLTNEQTTTYFAHKVPDYRSFCPYIGNTRHVQMEPYLQSLIVQRPAVYHSNYMNDLRERGLVN